MQNTRTFLDRHANFSKACTSALGCLLNRGIHDFAECKASLSAGTLVPSSRVAAKHVVAALNPCDRCILYDVYTEVTALEILNDHHAPRSSAHEDCDPPCKGPTPLKLHCYGMSNGGYWIVTEECATSLGEWRRSQNQIVAGATSECSSHSFAQTVARSLTYLRLFSEVSVHSMTFRQAYMADRFDVLTLRPCSCFRL